MEFSRVGPLAKKKKKKAFRKTENRCSGQPLRDNQITDNRSQGFKTSLKLITK